MSTKVSFCTRAAPLHARNYVYDNSQKMIMCPWGFHSRHLSSLPYTWVLYCYCHIRIVCLQGRWHYLLMNFSIRLSLLFHVLSLSNGLNPTLVLILIRRFVRQSCSKFDKPLTEHVILVACIYISTSSCMQILTSLVGTARNAMSPV